MGDTAKTVALKAKAQATRRRADFDFDLWDADLEVTEESKDVKANQWLDHDTKVIVAKLRYFIKLENCEITLPTRMNAKLIATLETYIMIARVPFTIWTPTPRRGTYLKQKARRKNLAI